jgi:radical SAM superfamily enzyme YgiQ (UPF0313 family)
MVKEGRCMQREGAWGYIMAPVTMVTVATMLRNHGHTVSVMDCPAEAADFEFMISSVTRLSPDIVVINTSTPSIEDDIHTATCIKKHTLRPTSTVLYGIHPSCQFRDILTPENGVDYCILGEPEFAIRDLVRAIVNGDRLQDIAGIAFLDKSDSLVVTSTREPIANLDELPIPDWTFVNCDHYRLPLNNEKFLLVNTNRGCPFRCTFCNAHVYYGHTPRHRSVAHIMEELTNDVKRFGVTNFMFWAEEFILDKNFVRDLCNAILASGMPVTWVCNSRVDAVDEEMVALIKKAGCWNIAFGIESGDQKVLDQINKKITLSMIASAVRMAKSAGLQVTGHVIVGFPMDSRKSIKTTEKFIDSLKLDFVQYYCAMPYPGTQLYDEAVKNGWLTTTDWQSWEHNYSVLDFDHLKASEIMKLRRRLMLRSYCKPSRIFTILKKNIKRPSDFMATLSKARGFFRWM